MVKNGFHKNHWLVVGLSAVLSGCSLFSPVHMPPVYTYEISAVPSAAPVKKSSRGVTIAVMMPESSAIYNTTQMAYTIAPYQVAYFAHSRWADTPPRMLQTNLIQALQNTHHFAAVVSPTFTGHVDYVLSTELLKLEQDFSVNPSVVRFAMRAQLVNATTNQVVGVRQITVTEDAPQNTPYAGVFAINVAAATVLNQIAHFSLRTH